MTVKQLREWLTKQDDSGKVSMKRKDEHVWRGDFQLSVTSDMDSLAFYNQGAHDRWVDDEKVQSGGPKL